jgi:triosephosphate isomerase
MRPCFVANWKMHKTIAETRAYLIALEQGLSKLPTSEWDIIIAPPYTAISAAAELINRLHLRVGLAAQNCYFEKEGAYTGEVSLRMLCEAGCQYVIIGHSERRVRFGETDCDIARKKIAVEQAGLTPILCVGETAEERQEGKTLSVVKRQIEEGIFCGEPENGPLSKGDFLIAYEPVWAIGTGKTPTPSDVEQIHREISETLQVKFSRTSRILYGGSANEQNIAAFMKEPHIDGVLAGGASLSAETFIKMIASVVEVKTTTQ